MKWEEGGSKFETGGNAGFEGRDGVVGGAGRWCRMGQDLIVLADGVMVGAAIAGIPTCSCLPPLKIIIHQSTLLPMGYPSH